MTPISQTDDGPVPEPAAGVAEPALPPVVVGIGGSAGALGAVMRLLESLGDARLAVVVVLHLSPDHESHAVEILQRSTPLKVQQVRQRMPLEAGCVYVVAPGMNLVTDDGHVQPGMLPAAQRPTYVIDRFFRSLGEVHHERAVAVVLSGTGQDGAMGLAQVRECGGLTIVQSPDDCEYPEMPKAAIHSGCVDLMLAAAEIGHRLADVAAGAALGDNRFPGEAVGGAHGAEGAPGADGARRAGGPNAANGTQAAEAAGGEDSAERAFHDILAALRVRTRHDFRHYKRATLMRRLERRMQIHRIATMQAYRDHVRRNPEELVPLLADFLISVTNFFRDTPAFEVAESQIVEPLLRGLGPGEEARVWVPACASGEEAYSVAILLQEQADRMAQAARVQIFASDINDAALAVARLGIYPSNVAADISEPRLMSYFEKDEGGRYRVRTSIREMIVFAHHNVLGDPPFSRLDLICCRNLLIYLDRTAQAAALDMFAYALKPGGWLFLGNAESVDASPEMFQVVSKEHRIYRLRPDAASRPTTRLPSQLVSVRHSDGQAAPHMSRRAFPERPADLLALVHERALVAAAPPSVLIDADGEIERVSQGAGRYVAFGAGVPTRSLLGNVAPDIRVELRAALFRASESQRPVVAVFRRSSKDGKDGQDAGSGSLTLTVHPVAAEEGAPVHFLVAFAEPPDELSRLGELPSGDDHAYAAAMRRLEDENRSLKTHLQETLDRSAVSTEELRASNEELQAINEELRSAKEELETSKEELQSVNEELTTVNFELRIKVDEAGRNNDDLRNLMEAADIATIFVDAGMRVKRYTPQASKLFALIPSDVGRPLMDVKSRLRYDEITDDASAVFKHLRPVERSVDSVDGEHYFARILPYRTSQDRIGGAVLTFINVTELRQAEDRVRAAQERLRDAISASRDFAVLSTDGEGRVVTWNEGATRVFGHRAADMLGKPMDLLFTPADRAAGIPHIERQDALRNGRASGERSYVRANGTPFFASGVLTPLHSVGGPGFLAIARDVSDARAREASGRTDLAGERRDHVATQGRFSQRDQFLALVSHELKQPLNLIQLNAELLVRLPEARALPNVQRIGQTLKQAVSAQATIVDDLLDLSRVQTGKLQLQRQPTDVSALALQLGNALAQDARDKQIELVIDAPQAVLCDCDPVRMEQIAWNLLGNALSFTGAGGRISVSVAAHEGRARLVVADTGVGITAEDQSRVFDLYAQGNRAVNAAGQRRVGLGIGLALVRELVQAHGGTIEVASAGEGRGSTFTVDLALAGSTATASATQAQASLAQRVLVVDDLADNLTPLVELLRMEGAQVDATTSAREALDMLERNTYDLVLSDIGMPEMSGYELMRRARALPAANRWRSVAITGYGAEDDLHEALASGFDGHLSKPVSIERLRAMLDTLGA